MEAVLNIYTKQDHLNKTHILRPWMLLYGTLHSSAVFIGDGGNRLKGTEHV